MSVPDEYSGSVISKLNMRKGMMKQMMSEGNGYSKMSTQFQLVDSWDIEVSL